MRVFRKSLSIVMAASMLVSSALPAVAAPETTGTEPSYHYIAFGDSVGAGFNMSSLTMDQRTTTRYLDMNYNNSPEDCYPAVAASLIKEALLEESYLSSADQFSFSNLCATGYKVTDFISLINDPDFIVASFRNSLYVPFEENRQLLAEVGEEAYKASIFETTKKELLDLLNLYRYGAQGAPGDQGAIGDQAVMAFNSNPYNKLYKNYNLHWGTEENFISWFDESFLTEGSFDQEKYDAWYQTWFNDSFIDYHLRMITGEDLKFHDLIIDEIQKADLITFDVGSNDLSQLAMEEMQRGSAPGEGFFNPNTRAFESTNNPILNIVSTVTSGMNGGNYGAISMIPSLVDQYRPKITMSDILETYMTMNHSMIEAAGKRAVDRLMESIPELTDQVQTINHEAGKDATIALVGRFDPYGNSLEVDGEIRNFQYVLKQVINYLLTANPMAAEAEEAVDETLYAGMTAMDDAELMEGYAEFEKALGKLEEALEDAADEEANGVVAAGPGFADPGAFDPAVPGMMPVNDYIFGLINTINEASRYPMTYLMMGKPVVAIMDYFDEKLISLAEEKGYVFIDNSGVPNQDRTDTHPDVPGHHVIGENIAKALVPDIIKETVGSGTIEGTSHCVYGHDCLMKVTPDEGYKIDSIYVNGEKMEDVDPAAFTFTLTNVTEDTTVKAVFSSLSGDSEPAGDPTNDPTGGSTGNPFINSIKLVSMIVKSLQSIMRGPWFSLRDLMMGPVRFPYRSASAGLTFEDALMSGNING